MLRFMCSSYVAWTFSMTLGFEEDEMQRLCQQMRRVTSRNNLPDLRDAFVSGQDEWNPTQVKVSGF
jgi:hypothetical protein